MDIPDIRDQIFDHLNHKTVLICRQVCQFWNESLARMSFVKLLQEFGDRDVERPPLKKEEEEVDIDLEDPEVQAATAKIQAGYKGMRTRRELKEKKDLEQKDAVKEEEEEVDIDLEDPEVQAATAKIQAGYKGMRTRRDMKDKKD